LEPLAFTPAVTPGFFDTLELRVLQGRGFTPADRADTPLVTVINETMARALWSAGQNPIGQRIGSTDPNNRIWREVVGVVRDARAGASIDEVVTPFQMYRPLAQAPEGSLALALRTRLAPESLAPELRRAAVEIDSSQPITAISTVRDQIDGSFNNLELGGWSLASFAFLGVLLAALGIYAVIANSVVQRTYEIGIRMALGATMRDVLALVIGQGLRLALLGTAIGIAGAWGVARLLSAMMPAVPLAGVAATAGATGLLLSIATLACWLPARRATKVDPMTALRAE
jgi:ABC-type lipoprotein release transport system permease subunit